MKKAILFTTSVFVTFAVTAQADVSAKITDYYKDVINTQPYQVEVCSNVHVPGDRSGDMLRGAIIGGIIGNNVTKNLPDGGTAGAIIGGKDDTAEAKMKIMRESGLIVAESPANIGAKLKEVL